MRFLISILILLVSCNGFAKTLSIELTNPHKNESFSYSLDLKTFKLKVSKEVVNSIFSDENHNYSIIDGSLVLNGSELIDANEVLFVKKFVDYDIVIIRETYNSFSNPLKLLVAVAGHPMQVTKIYGLKIKSDKVINDIRILKQDNASSWDIKVAAAN